MRECQRWKAWEQESERGRLVSVTNSIQATGEPLCLCSSWPFFSFCPHDNSRLWDTRYSFLTVVHFTSKGRNQTWQLNKRPCSRCQTAQRSVLLLIWKPVEELPVQRAQYYPRPWLFILATLLSKNPNSLTLESPRDVMRRIWALLPRRCSSSPWPWYFLLTGGWELLDISECLFPHLGNSDNGSTALDDCEDGKGNICQGLATVRGMQAHTHISWASSGRSAQCQTRRGRGVGAQSQLRHGPPHARARLVLSFCHPSCSFSHLYHKA